MSLSLFAIPTIVADAIASIPADAEILTSDSAGLNPVILYRLPAAALLTAIVLMVFARHQSRSNTPSPPAAIGPSTSPLLLFAIGFGLFFLTHLLGGLTVGLVPAPHDGEHLVRSASAAACVYGWAIVLSALAWLWARRFLHEQQNSVRFLNLLRGVLWLVPLIPVLVLVSDSAVVVHTVLTGRPPNPIAHATLEQIVHEPWRPAAQILMAGALLAAPVFEETVYRGFLQSAWGRVFKKRWLAIVVTAVMFALSHRIGIDPVPWHAIPSILVLGMACGYVFERHGLLAAIGLHAAFNAVNLALALVLVDL